MNVGGASLLVATSDLKMVQGIIGAMRAADAASGKGQAVTKLGPAPSQIRSRLVHDPEPRFNSRPVIDPTPRFQPRAIYRPTPAVARPPAPPVDAEKPRVAASPLVPPWKMPLPVKPVAQEASIKPNVVPADVQMKGTLLDLFI